MDPAVWKIWVKKNGTADLPPNLFIRNMTDGLYIQGAARLPKVFPSTNQFLIPIVLQPDYSKIPAPVCRYSEVYGINTYEPNLWGFSQAVCQYTDYNPNTHTWEWKTGLCGNNDSRVDVYYRDIWVNTHLNSGACVGLSSTSMTEVDGIWLPDNPHPPFVDFGRIPATEKTFWTEPIFWDPTCK